MKNNDWADPQTRLPLRGTSWQVIPVLSTQYLIPNTVFTTCKKS